MFAVRAIIVSLVLQDKYNIGIFLSPVVPISECFQAVRSVFMALASLKKSSLKCT